MRPCPWLIAWLAMLPLGRLLAGTDPGLNQLQYIGSHNSYHAGLGPGQQAIWRRIDPAQLPILQYSHPSLPRQLEAGVRQLELDIFNDTHGGRYAHPGIQRWIAAAGLPADASAAVDVSVMNRPGFKVMHIQDLDPHSNCQPLVACLQQIRAWSRRHPGHLPIFVLFETVTEALHYPPATVVPEPFDRAALDALDSTLRRVFPAGSYICPDQVRGSYPSLNEAVLTHGWPRLSQARGKIIFLLDQSSVNAAYLQGHPALRGRMMFTHAQPGTADAAFIELNDGPAARITALVRQGYLVRTRTDADLIEARHNDTRRRDAMLASGAQLLSTDYPFYEHAASGYAVSFGDARPARCNPVFLAACSTADTQEPETTHVH